MLAKTSDTFPPLTVMSCPTLYIFLSNLTSTWVLSALTSTSSRTDTSRFKETVPRSVSPLTNRLLFV